jgi:hypothetical protein
MTLSSGSTKASLQDESSAEKPEMEWAQTSDHHDENKFLDLECQRLRQVPSYASQVGGDGGLPEEEVDENGRKDKNLVDWDGPHDSANPYNW